MKLLENAQRSLWSIYLNFQKGEWHLPEHQRKLVWDNQKIKKWHDDIKYIHKTNPGGTVEGLIIIYSVTGDSKIYLNDGAQRAYWTILKFIEDCKINNINFLEILSSVMITVQRVEYPTVSEAIDRFIQINFGTTATPFELTRTMMIQEIEDFSDIWQPRLDKISESINRILIRLGVEVEDRKDVQKRETAHKRTRDDYNLFWKYASEDKELSNLKAGLSNLKPDRWKVHSQIERNLTYLFKHCGVLDIDQKIIKFETTLKYLAAIYEEKAADILSVSSSRSNVHVRWWLLACIWLKNCGQKHRIPEFTIKLLKGCRGKSTLSYRADDGGIAHVTKGMSNLSYLRKICSVIDFDISFFNQEKERRKNKPKLKSGFQHSHKFSFAKYGEGITVPENGLENMLRSFNDMDNERYEELVNLAKNQL